MDHVAVALDAMKLAAGEIGMQPGGSLVDVDRCIGFAARDDGKSQFMVAQVKRISRGIIIARSAAVACRCDGRNASDLGNCL